jgi:hypothetical protein
MDLCYQPRYPFFLFRGDLDAPVGLFQQGFYGPRLGKIQEDIPPEILRKMDHGGINRQCLITLKIGVIVSPVVRQVGADQDDIPWMEAFDMVADELGASAAVKIDQLYFDVIVPAIVDNGSLSSLTLNE